MTRIVAGTAGGRTLRVPARGTRPTSDRVREALFSRLDHLGALHGSRVLDLYAGSGALGLEAASRGAVDVVLVESARSAVQVCRQNVATTGLGGVRVVAEKVVPFLRRPGGEGTVDVALLDPPYDLADGDLADVLAALVPHLAVDAVVVVERGARTSEPAWPVGLRRTDERRYGETVLWFATTSDADPSDRPTDALTSVASPGQSGGAAAGPAGSTVPAVPAVPTVAP